ncbi:MAG: outer membrane beta-barrel protein [Candidatus Latescibacterota bacterium]|nr:outer membrane beta-barrel protein [Candidatus Latescibacterota bacterium]
MKGFLHIFAVFVGLTSMSDAQIAITDQLSATGFFDMSAVNADGTSTASFDQAEIDFVLDFENGWTARADVNWKGKSPTQVSDILEQAFLTYTHENGAFLNAGKFLSSTGWETAEPTGLYQFSVSNTLVYGGYQSGVSFGVSNGKVRLYGAVVASVWDGNDYSAEELGAEAAIKFTPGNGFTGFAAYAVEDKGSYNTGLLNIWASYQTGSVTLAAEANSLSGWGAANNNGFGYLGMINVALTDRFGITGRYSVLDTDNTTKVDEITFSPSLKIKDNWSVIAELRRNLDVETTTLALESLVTF